MEEQWGRQSLELMDGERRMEADVMDRQRTDDGHGGEWTARRMARWGEVTHRRVAGEPK